MVPQFTDEWAHAVKPVQANSLPSAGTAPSSVNQAGPVVYFSRPLERFSTRRCTEILLPKLTNRYYATFNA